MQNIFHVGTILYIVYYKYYGYPWVGINGPNKTEIWEMLINPPKIVKNVHQTGNKLEIFRDATDTIALLTVPPREQSPPQNSMTTSEVVLYIPRPLVRHVVDPQSRFRIP